MSQGSDLDDTVVQHDGVTVEKRFTADEFPVPAVAFTLRTERDDPAEFRLVDEIPEDFPMDRVGFHPEYESEHWTAYQDHRVEYRRRLEPGEEVTTVYGIRTDDPSTGASFLGEPTIEEVDEDADPVGDVADVIGEDSSQVVRDVLSGDRDAIPGDEDAPASGPGAISEAEGSNDATIDLAAAEDDLGLTDPAADEDEDPEQAADDDAVADAVGDDPDPLADPLEAADDDDEPADDDDDGSDDSGAELDADEGDADEGGLDVPTEEAGEDDLGLAEDPDVTEPTGDAGAGATQAAAGGIAAALATELRSGEVSEADRELLKRELELDHATSVDARISRLQSTVEDLAAYTDALEEFIDENGTADDLIEGLQADVTEVRDALDDVEADVESAAAERAELFDDVEDVRGAVDDVTDDVAERAEGLEASVAEIRSELEELQDEVAEEDDAVAEVRDEMADVEDELESLSAMMDEEVGELRADLAEMHTELEEFEAFRERLSSVFGAGGAGAPGMDEGNGDAE
ncbi:hypothetical protein [Halorarum halobium]|uniref:hypothetical protein n=1 Tax=Halorarum halobium TaxID=3075121 RepID=UPI0028AEF02A|nr:hypothetical protein [Halobaculum sp. XH14]